MRSPALLVGSLLAGLVFGTLSATAATRPDSTTPPPAVPASQPVAPGCATSPAPAQQVTAPTATPGPSPAPAPHLPV